LLIFQFDKVSAKTRGQNVFIKNKFQEAISRPRSFFCPKCPVACVSEVNLLRHLEREHTDKSSPDDSFELHRNCERCAALFNSYLDNKESQVGGLATDPLNGG
jgi:hypothetical protein